MAASTFIARCPEPLRCFASSQELGPLAPFRSVESALPVNPVPSAARFPSLPSAHCPFRGQVQPDAEVRATSISSLPSVASDRAPQPASAPFQRILPGLPPASAHPLENHPPETTAHL